jgi:hypothetical protein
MNRKFELLKLLLFAALLCLLVLAIFFWLANPSHQVPAAFKQLLITAFLFWIMSVFLNPNKDDDWAGEF